MSLFRALVLLWLGAAPVRADEDEARRHYQAGVGAYERHAFDEAYREFRAAYAISKRAELLYDMSRALEQLKRPHDAAEELRGYLRVTPDAPDRPQVEERIRALDEEQRLLDVERARATVVVIVTPAKPPPERPRRRGLVIGVSVGAALVVAVGLGVGLGLGLHPSSGYPPAELGSHQATP